MKASERKINSNWTKHYVNKGEMEHNAKFDPSKVTLVKGNGECVDVTQKYISSC